MISAFLRYCDLNSLIRTHSRLAFVLSSVLYRRALSPPEHQGSWLLYYAVISRVHTLLQVLLTTYGVDPNDKLTCTGGWRQQSLLHIAISSSGIKSARILLEAGIDVSATDSTKTTALHLASRTGNVEMISLLATYGANLEAVDNENRTPLHTALTCGPINRSAAITALLSCGANPNSLVSVSRIDDALILGWSALHLAAIDFIDPSSVIRLLVEYGADLEQPLLNTNPPCTPLAFVCEVLVWTRLGRPGAVLRVREEIHKGYQEIWKAVEVLLELGADIEPAFLALRPRPYLTFMTDISTLKTEHPVFTYLGVLPSQMLVRARDRGLVYNVTEKQWVMMAEIVKKELVRASNRLRRRKNRNRALQLSKSWLRLPQ